MKQTNKNYQLIENTEQRTEEWFAMREGMVTGSVATQCKVKNGMYLYEVLATMTTNTVPKQLNTPAVLWGIEQEPVARVQYERKTGREVTQCGFIKNGRYGLSPDGLVMKKVEIERTVEIKCPDSKTHIYYYLNKGVPKEYRDQIIHNFVVIDDLQTLDFVSYDPRVKVQPFYIYTITRDALATEIALAKVAYDIHLKRLDEAYKALII